MSDPRERDAELEPFDYMHPLGILTLVLNHDDRELFMVSFTPAKEINPKEVTSLDWYFQDGKCTGWGIGQKGWKHHLKRGK